MRGSNRAARFGRGAIAVVLGLLGVLTPIAAGTSGAADLPLDFTVDAGGTITYVVPAAPGNPLTVLSTETLSGGYTLIRDRLAPVQGEFFGFSTLHLVTASGRTIDSYNFLPGNAQSGMECFNGAPPGCLMTTPFITQGVPNATGPTYTLDSTYLVAEGAASAPTGHTWTNVGIYRSSFTEPFYELIAYMNFHATRPGATLDPPAIEISAPVDGGVYPVGQSVTASYTCTDLSGTGISSCAGPVASGDLLDTSTAGSYSFTITATDGNGAASTATATYEVVAPLTFAIDSGATFTPLVPTSSAPVTALTPESLTGSFTVQRLGSSPNFGSHRFAVTAMHLATSSGTTFDLAPGSASHLICWDQAGQCSPQISLGVTGLPTATSVIAQTTGLAIGEPRWEGPQLAPTGFDWAPPNLHVPAGSGVYRQGSSSLEIVGTISFHASRSTPDTTVPAIDITSPTDGAQYSLGQDVVASYACTDSGGSGIDECLGSAASGDAIDTTTAGVHEFTVDATDNTGNHTSTTVDYEVLAGNLAATVTGEEILTTDPGGVGATPEVPVQTEIHVPAGVAGSISVTPQPAGAPPSGFALFDQQLELTGPDAPSAAEPYAVTFTIDAGQLGAIAPGDVQVFRNGTLVADCTSATDAAPDPCVDGRGTLGDGSGDAFVSVRTTQFSTWTLGHRLLEVTGVSPATRAQGLSHQLMGVIGNGFADGATVTVSGVGVTVHAMARLSPSSLLIDVTFAADATIGARDVTVTNPGPVSATCTACLIVGARPTIAAVTPTARPVGASHQTITMTGTGFQNGAAVAFSGTGITVHSKQVVDAAHLTLDISIAANAPLGSRTITVTNPDGGKATRSAAFTVNALPTLTSVTPNRARQAQTLTVQLTGSGFPANFASGGRVLFGSGVTVNSLSRTSATTITASISVSAGATAGPRAVTIENPDGGRATCGSCLTVIANPTIASVSPAARVVGATNQNLIVTGIGFQAGVTAKFSGTGVVVNSVTRTSSTSLKVNVSIGTSAATGARSLTITNPDTGTTTCTACFAVNAKPTITSLSPNALKRGLQHRTVVLTGTGFRPGVSVSMSGTGITVVVKTVTSTSVTLDVSVAANASATARTVTVTNTDGGIVNRGSAFKVNP